MAAFTSKASGNWSATGQTTWNEVGVPGNGDTVTITTHNIVVDVNTTVGTSGVAGTLAVSTATGALSVAAGVTFTVRGDLQYGNSAFTLGAGATYLFDSSLAASPSTTNYAIIYGTASSQQNTKLVCNGTQANPVIFDNAPSSGRGQMKRFSAGGSAWSAFNCQYTQFNHIGTTTKYVIECNCINSSFAEATFNHCTFVDCGFVYLIVGAANDLKWTFNEMRSTIQASQPLWFVATAKTTGARIVTDNIFLPEQWTSAYTNYFSGNSKGFTFERNVTCSLNTTSWSDSSPFTSFKDNLILCNTGGLTSLGGNGDTFQNTYMLTTGNGGVAGTPLGFTGTHTMDGYIFESTSLNEDADMGHISAPASGLVTQRWTRCISKQNPRGFASGGIEAHGNNFVDVQLDHNTMMFGDNQSPTTTRLFAHYVGSGYAPHTGMYKQFRNNIFWDKQARVNATGDWATGNVGQAYTGTADAGGSTTTLVDASPTPAFATGMDLGNMVVVMTSGPDAGLYRTITNRTGSTLTFAAFPNITDGQTYRAISLDVHVASEAKNNAMFNAAAANVVDPQGLNSTSCLGMGYLTPWYVTSPSTFMQDTINLGSGTDYTTAGPMFKDPTRNFARFSGVYLGRTASAWSSGDTVVEGDFRKNSVSTW